MAMAAVLTLGSGTASYALMSEAWVKVEFKFKASDKNTTILADIPVTYAKDVAQYCERDLFWAEKGLAFTVQQGHPELADAKFVGLKCVTEGGKIKWAKKPTDLLPRQQPLPDLAGVKLFFADPKGKEVSGVYQERRDHMSSADCEKRLGSLVARYKQMASQDKRLGKMTFIRGECVVLKTFN
ncbi:MAG: hypothetical protein JWQ89_545 [Devosia sp.]|uniref:hypothetical protein n=1 Tax=Devosia sp. TaxID=1871048 RepID=UPI0026115941|nr:hypothetical protein [Devosia sp.]MDB5538818.1 hypothetical protein [Devosia sp.]